MVIFGIFSGREIGVSVVFFFGSEVFFALDTLVKGLHSSFTFEERISQITLSKGMSGRGGARHTSKPFIEGGLLFKLFSKHKAIIQDFKGYESLSRNSGVDPTSLLHSLDLVNDILDLEPTCEIHPQPLRHALLHMLQQTPSLNNLQQSGNMWVHLRCERINVLLFHVRRLARTGNTATCVGALSGSQLSQLQATLQKVKMQAKGQPEQQLVPLEKGENQQKEPPLKKGQEKKRKNEEEPHETEETPLKKGVGQKRKLKVNPSDVSLGSQGFPKLLQSPAERPKRILGKRVGGMAAKKNTQMGDLREAMGFTMKKPAAKATSTKSKPAAAEATLKKGVPAPPCLEGEGPWLKLHKTMAKKPERAYILGTKVEGMKPKLIVEVSKAMTNQYYIVIDKILEALKNDNISREEAKDMRAKLLKRYL